jgi:hypothetical protein
MVSVGNSQEITQQDKVLGRKVLRLTGSVMAANSVQLPKAPLSLGLTGRYMLIQLRGFPERYYVFHVQVNTQEGVTATLSFGSLYKDLHVPTSLRILTRQRSGNVVQVPLNLSGKWTCLTIDLVACVERWCNMKFASVRMLKFCSELLVRNVLTSDRVYPCDVSPAASTSSPFRNTHETFSCLSSGTTGLRTFMTLFPFLPLSVIHALHQFRVILIRAHRGTEN